MNFSPSRASTQFWRVRVKGTSQGAAVDPTGDAVYIAIVALGVTPAASDFKAATWSTEPDGYYALLLVGPGAGAAISFASAAAGTQVAVWVKVTDDPEVPVLLAGTVTLV